ncbi:MAG TPA: J domain-containing protein [bacterium]|nr:J domain-containing protein [bacterium]
MANESVAEQNRRKLEEHLAKVREQGGKVGGGKDTADNAKAQADPTREIPKAPPPPPGWEAWKKAHGGRLHQVRYVDAGKAAEAADYKLLDLKPGASREEIRKAFARLAQEHHPDHGGDAEIFAAMQVAYKRLMKDK